MTIMEQIYLTKILVFCTLIFQAKTVMGCTCRKVPLVEQFCNADFVIKMKINSHTDIGNPISYYPIETRIYQFDIMKVYKIRSNDIIPMLLHGEMTTDYKYSCGVRLEDGDTLIYGGNFIESQLPDMHTCDLTIHDEEAMKKFEKNNFIYNPYYCEYLNFDRERSKFFYRNLE
ncbi:uncharacterized protein LOC130666581 [Microplitis mediator]|uniref:uncharacterized protein LOC130666581 n=1 Tax=Microplitis mediator TaxID=375433 RepID=UPI002552B7AB|nr:uncharacterized protein LOC130666581 [Microplitis mediator]